jgi:hypothetical protein
VKPPDMENESTTPLPEWFDPFPEPQTMPSGWDLSELILTSNQSTVLDSEAQAENRPLTSFLFTYH